MKAKEDLLKLGIVIDNEYLDKYISLFNEDSPKNEVTQKHHFIPVYYYKELYPAAGNTARKIANEDVLNEIKSVSIRTHILLHFYLEKCSVEKFRGKNIFSVYRLLGHRCEKQKLYKILTDENLLDEYLTLLNGNYLFTEEHHQHLKDAIKNRKSSTNNNISKNGYIGGTTGLKMMYDNDGKRRYVSKELVQEKLELGWTFPTNKKRTDVINNTTQLHTYVRHKSQEEVHKNLSESHKGKSPANKGVPCSEEKKQKLAESIRGRIWINNGKERKQIKKEELELYIKLGYILGFSIQKNNKNNNDNGGDINEVN